MKKLILLSAVALALGACSSSNHVNFEDNKALTKPKPHLLIPATVCNKTNPSRARCQ